MAHGPYLRGLSALGLLLLPLAGCTTLTRMVSGSAEALESDGIRELREPMRPIRGTTRVLIVALDGVGDDDLREAVASGAMPRVAALLGPPTGEPDLWAHAWAAPDVVSAFPAVTVPGWAQVFTGEPPAVNGIVGGEWFDRDSVRLYAPVPLSVSSRDHVVATYRDSLVGQALGVPTLYELADLRAHVSFSQIYRGADVLTTPAASGLLDFVGGVLEGMLDAASVEQEVYKEMDEGAVKSVLDAIEEYGLPDIQTVYFPGVDLYTHVTENPVEAQRDYLSSVVDRGLGKIIDAYQQRRALDRTFVVFVADHGHTPVLDDDRHALESEERPAAVLRDAGFRVRPLTIEPDSTGRVFDTVLAYQDGAAYVYLADRSTCPDSTGLCDWAQPPRLEEDVLPAARAFFEAGADTAPDTTLRGALDLVLVRHAASGEPGRFSVLDGDRLVPVADYLAATPRPDLIRFEERLKDLADGPYADRVGDLVLLARSGDEWPLEERYYFSPAHASGHGSAGRQDSVVPLVVARFGASGVALRQLAQRVVAETLSQRAVTPLVRALLEVDTTPASRSGGKR